MLERTHDRPQRRSMPKICASLSALAYAHTHACTIMLKLCLSLVTLAQSPGNRDDFYRTTHLSLIILKLQCKMPHPNNYEIFYDYHDDKSKSKEKRQTSHERILDECMCNILQNTKKYSKISITNIYIINEKNFVYLHPNNQIFLIIQLAQLQCIFDKARRK